MSISIQELTESIQGDADLLKAFNKLGIDDPIKRILKNLEEPEIKMDWSKTYRSWRRVTLPDDYALYAHQVWYIEKLLYRFQNAYKGVYGGIVPLQMGFGKTLIALMVIKILGLKTLFVCEKTLLQNVAMDIKKFFPEMKRCMITPQAEHFGIPPDEALITLTTYDAWVGLQNRSKKYGDMIDNYKGFQIIVADESHCLSPGTKRFEALHNLQARYRICLTGTPGTFAKQFHQLIFCGLQGFDEKRLWDEITFKSNRLQKLVLDHEADIDLPELQYIDLPITFNSTEEKNAYNHLLRETMKAQEQYKAKQMKVWDYKKWEKALTRSCTAAGLCADRLPQSCMNWCLSQDSTANTSSSKMVAINTMIQSLPPTDKFIVFCSDLDLLKVAQKSCAFSSVILHGSVKDHNGVLEQFNRTTRGLYTAKVGAQGLNLTHANHIFFLTPETDATLRKQMVARCYRIGQKKKVCVYHVFIHKSIEETHHGLNENKYDISEAFVGGKFNPDVFRKLVSS